MIAYSLKYRVRRANVSGRNSSSIPTRNSPLLILLHGVGGQEDDLLELAAQFDERFTVFSVRAPFEQSPTSFAWYRISPFLDEHNYFVDDAEESREKLVRFIHEVVSTNDFDPQQVYLLGFGQGATIALSVLLTDPGILRGAAFLSGEILPEVIHMRVSREKLRDFPVYLAYGIHDQIVPVQIGRKTRDILRELDIDISYREYPIGHHLAPMSLRDASHWLTMQLDANKKVWFGQTTTKLHLGHVQLRVRDLDRSIVFYKRFLGLRVTERLGKLYAFLSSGYHHHDLALQSVGPGALDIPPNSVGVINIAFEVVDQVALAEIYQQLLNSDIPVRASDHFISWSLYFHDPDGHEIEVYCDTRDMHGRSDLWQGRDSPLDTHKFQEILKLKDL
jgi:phospholipase/carboxylesterase